MKIDALFVCSCMFFVLMRNSSSRRASWLPVSWSINFLTGFLEFSCLKGELLSFSEACHLPVSVSQ